jgi:hypothetical protein
MGCQRSCAWYMGYLGLLGEKVLIDERRIGVIGLCVKYTYPIGLGEEEIVARAKG